MSKSVMVKLFDWIRQAIFEALEVKADMEEVWLDSEGLAKQFCCFTENWQKKYAMTLPRTQAIVTDENGKEYKSHWMYPRNKIQKMMHDGKIKNLVLTK